MFNSYFKLAIKVLGRRRFFTFVSLFGISFTLMILMVIMAFLDTELGANAPMSKADRMVLIDRVEMTTNYFDTLWQVDSNLLGDELVLDTLGFETQDAGQSISMGAAGYRVFSKDLGPIEQAENLTYMFDRAYDVFTNGRKFQMNALHATASYWEVLDFEFLEGRPFNAAEDEQGKSVLVLTDQLAKEYFGTTQGIIGRTIPLSGRQYEVIGMVARPRSSSSFIRADLFLPLGTADAQTLSSRDIMGPFRAIYLAPTAASRKAMQDALDYAGRQLPIPPEDEFEEIRIYAFTPVENYAHQIFFQDDCLFWFRLTLFGLLGFFILIPTLNLINLNLSRMMERAAEIGVRKAFGASSRHILLQFLFENIVVTFVGGLIGLLLALLVIYFINSSGALPTVMLGFNWTVFGYSFLACLFFGILSGLLPAWRMSRLQIVNGLSQ